MSTPGAICVYVSGSGVPENVRERRWRGVYHHWSGEPSDLGQHLIKRLQEKRGDVRAVVRTLIDQAPWGWSSCFEAKERTALQRLRGALGLRPDADPDRYTRADPGLLVTPNDTSNVAFVYVFDIDARRIDAFATHSDADGQRIGSVEFSPEGEPTVPAFDLLPEERVDEPPIPGPPLSASDLTELLGSLDRIQGGAQSLEWVDTSEAADLSLSITFRVIAWNEGSITDVIEREWNLVPAHARSEPERVRAALAALVTVLAEDPSRLDAFWIASLDPLRRSGARQVSTFAAQFRAHAQRNL